MMKEKKENAFEDFFMTLPFIWINTLITIFVVIMFVELGYLIYKTTGVGSFFLLNLFLVKLLIFGFIYLLMIYIIVFVMSRFFIPKLKEKQSKRKKEFIEELSREIKKELKLKK